MWRTKFLLIAYLIGMAALSSANADGSMNFVVKSEDSASAPLTVKKTDGESKVYPFNSWSPDGKTNFDNPRLTIIRHVAPNLSSMSVRFSFHQYNVTENDKGQHQASLSIELLGSSGNILAVVFGGNNIVRDRCRDIGDVLFGPTEMSDETYDLITSARMNYSSSWNYEGGC